MATMRKSRDRRSAPGKTTGKTPGNAPRKTPGKTTAKASRKTTAKAPGKATAKVSGKTTAKAPGEATAKASTSTGARSVRTDAVERRGSDRRIHPRVLVDIEVDYKCEDTFLFAYITDISAMGIFIRTNNPEPPGTRLNLRFTPPGASEMNVEARVRWVNPFRPGSYDNINPGMGVEFVDLTAAQRETLVNLVRTFAYLSDDDDTRGNS